MKGYTISTLTSNIVNTPTTFDSSRSGLPPTFASPSPIPSAQQSISAIEYPNSSSPSSRRSLPESQQGRHRLPAICVLQPGSRCHVPSPTSLSIPLSYVLYLRIAQTWLIPQDH
ncbi:hypothetical protein FRC02_006543 [Tulasnella sp. 418]|nr:hypothetical protein FRC02_006543 [Tulasnella sp. 418]